MIHFEHLEEIKEGYFKHGLSALYISYKMFVGSAMALIHAIYPDLFKSNASEICREIVIMVDSKHKKQITS